MSRFALGKTIRPLAYGLMPLLLAAGAIRAAPPASLPATFPAPDAAVKGAAMRQVQELQASRKLDARGLLNLSLDTTSSPALRYAAARHAMDLAANTGQAAVALDAIHELAARFGEDELVLGSELAKRLAKSGRNDAAAILGCRYLDAALTAGRRNLTTDLNGMLTGIRPSLDTQLAAFCVDAMEDYQYACEVLPAPASATAPASSVVYACLYQNRWDSRLEDLAQARAGGELSQIAREDLAATDLAARTAVAERWWQAAQELGGRTGWRVARRACAIYATILPQVDGVQKALIAGRLAEHQRQEMIQAGMLPGIIREIWKENSSKRDRQPVSTMLLPRDAKLAALPRSDAHVRFLGQILVEQPGRYELIFLAGSGLRVQIDGKLAIDNPKAYSKRNGEKLSISLSAGLHPVEIEVWSASSQPRLELQWTLPSSKDKQPLPDSVLYHDPLLQ